MFLTTLFINANCYGQRKINSIETWTSTGITSQGTPSAGSTLTLEGEFGHKSFDLTDWNNGIYFYEVKFKGLVFANGKFVKQ